MDSDRTFNHAVASWLRDEPDRSADRVVDEAIQIVNGLPQRRPVAPAAVQGRERVVLPALGAAAALVVVLASGLLLPDVEGPGATASPSRSPRFAPRATDFVGPIVTGRTQVSVDGIRFTFDMPDWERFGDGRLDYLSKSDRRGQAAEGQLYFAAFPSQFVNRWECAYLSAFRDSQHALPTAVALADAVASVPGTELVSGPEEALVGGLVAYRVEFIVRDDVGCDPGFFYMYESVLGGALWPETTPGDTVRVWVVDRPVGPDLFIEAKTKPDAGDGLLEDIRAIVDSVAFE